MSAAPAPAWRIDYLARHPRLVPTLARWHHAEWSALLPRWSLATATAELAGHVRTRALPTTLVALDGDGAPLGSVSLLDDDHDELTRWSPWLASLYVVPGARGAGLGRALVTALRDEARALAVPRLHLYTEDRRAWYASLGWSPLERITLGSGHTVDVMAIVP